FANPAKLLKASIVFGLWPYVAIKPSDGLHVVRNNLLAAFDHSIKSIPVSFGVGDECFNGRFGTYLFCFDHGLIPNLGAAILELVAIDRGDDRVLDLH